MTGLASSPCSWPGVSVTCNNSAVPWHRDCVGCCRESHLMLQDMAFRCYSHFPSLGPDTWTQWREHSLFSPEITLVGHCQPRSVVGPWAEPLWAVTSPSPWVTHRWQCPAQQVASSIMGRAAGPGTRVATRSPPSHPHKGISLPPAQLAPK